jgi:hypothetical protein
MPRATVIGKKLYIAANKKLDNLKVAFDVQTCKCANYGSK